MSLSDSEYAEGQDSSDHEEEDMDIRPSMTKEHRELMRHLQYMFPERFLNSNAESIPAAQKLFQINTSTPLLKLNPTLIGSWLDPPKSEDSATGCWPKDTKFPKGSIPYRKGYDFKPPTRPSDIAIIDPNLKKLLEAPKIKEANLDPTIFRSTEATKFSGTALPSTDFFQRGGFSIVFTRNKC